MLAQAVLPTGRARPGQGLTSESRPRQTASAAYVSIAIVKRTTIYFDPELEALLKAETLRRNQPMAELVREAVREYIVHSRPGSPPGAGEFSSGHADTADRCEEILTETGFGTSR